MSEGNNSNIDTGEMKKAYINKVHERNKFEKIMSAVKKEIPEAFKDDTFTKAMFKNFNIVLCKFLYEPKEKMTSGEKKLIKLIDKLLIYHCIMLAKTNWKFYELLGDYSNED